MLDILNKLFPKDEEERRSSKFIERGLEALRMVRDSHTVAMGELRRTPSNFELRVSTEQYALLTGMDALRDMSFYFKDALMKDLATHGMRTYGDHTIRVAIAPDAVLGPNEIYVVVLNPERKSTEQSERSTRVAKPAPPDDATRVLAEEGKPEEQIDATVVLSQDVGNKPVVTQIWNLTLRFPDGRTIRERLNGSKWILGRRGSTGSSLAGYQKIELDLPLTVSREQVALELDQQTMVLRRIGKAPITFANGDELGEDESRRLETDQPFFIEEIEVRILNAEL